MSKYWNLKKTIYLEWISKCCKKTLLGHSKQVWHPWLWDPFLNKGLQNQTELSRFGPFLSLYKLTRTKNQLRSILTKLKKTSFNLAYIVFSFLSSQLPLMSFLSQLSLSLFLSLSPLLCMAYKLSTLNWIHILSFSFS